MLLLVGVGAPPVVVSTTIALVDDTITLFKDLWSLTPSVRGNGPSVGCGGEGSIVESTIQEFDGACVPSTI